MQSNKRLVLAIPLAVLLTLLNLYAEDLYHWLTGDYLATIEKSIPYKLLLQMCLGILSGTLVCLALLFLYIQKVWSLSKVQTTEQVQTAKESKSEQAEMLQHLSNDEKALLKTFFDNNTRCIELSASRGPAIGLRSRLILYCPSQEHLDSIMDEPKNTYCVAEWAWIHLKKHPALLEESPPLMRSSEVDVEKKHMRVLQNLSRDEKACVRQCYIGPENKVWVFRDGDPTPMGLVDQGVLYTSSRMDISLTLNFHIQPWAWEMLRENPELLD